MRGREGRGLILWGGVLTTLPAMAPHLQYPWFFPIAKRGSPNTLLGDFQYAFPKLTFASVSQIPVAYNLESWLIMFAF